MGLSQSLYTGYTGLATHQRSMDNLGNNLANANTVGYKQSDFMFSNIFKKAITGAMPGDGVRGTTNPKNVGLGTTTGAILNNFKAGPTELTGDPLHLRINDPYGQANSFFLVNTSSGTALTRNGKFYLDHTINPNERMLCADGGLPVQGWMGSNGTVDPSGPVGNIYLPAEGDKMAGQVSTNVNIKGILPTNTSKGFEGSQTTELNLYGNLGSGDNSLTTSVYMPVTVTDGTKNSVRDEYREVKVKIDFQGPTLSEDGTTNDWTYTMSTVDWPEPGDPPIQIYPTESDPNFPQGKIGFHTQGSTTGNYGPGQAASDSTTPGATRVRSVKENEDGTTTTTLFNIPADFKIDISRLTNSDSPAVAEGVSTWSVNGNPKGTMKQTVNVYDEYTAYEAVTDASGNSTMQAVRKVEFRENALIFTREGSDNTSTTWSWTSSMDGKSGELVFDTNGDLVSSTQSDGGVSYDFSAVRNIAQEGLIQITDQDGFRDGVLREITIDGNGKIWGHYTNDVADPLAWLAMGTVPNKNGLEGASGTLFYPGIASGELVIGVAGDAMTDFGIDRIGAGSLSSGELEGSNVDLSKEFTNMIQIERGYQFNSKIVTTSDEMLQTALQLKR